MATKTAYLTALAALSYITEVGTANEVTEESISEISYTVYDVYVLERNNGEGASVKHRFVVYDEGGGSEEVLTEYVPYFKENLTGYNALISEIESISNLKSYWVKTINTDLQFAIVRACILGTGIDFVWYLIYNEGGLQTAVINNPEDF